MPAGDANADGDYPVNSRKLANMVAPCLVHMLDAFFASLVMERLAARGVPHFVSIHDCWLVPAGVQQGQDVLGECIRDAGREWFAGLGPVYEHLIGYLGEDPEFGPFVRGIKATWEHRLREGRWPTFAAPESRLYRIEQPGTGEWQKLGTFFGPSDDPAAFEIRVGRGGEPEPQAPNDPAGQIQGT